MASTHPFQDKVIVVSGASRGTGLALSRYLLVRGAKVSMAATSSENLAQALKEIEKGIPEIVGQDRVMTAVVDISKSHQVKSWIEDTVAKWGELDGAANVAAKMNERVWPIETLPVEELEQMLSVNVVGTFNCLQHEMRHMKRGGSIVNCGSVMVKYAMGNMSAYAAAKNAVRGLSQSAAHEGAAKGIRVNMVSPGCIDTDMIKEPRILPNGEPWTMTENNDLCSIIKRYAKPDEIAASIAFLLGDESKFITKQEWYVDGGWLETNQFEDATKVSL